MNNIWYLTPFCTQKRLGHIHNQYCALVPNDEDYICLMDPDVMFLHPHQQKWIEDIVISEEAKGYDVLGCMTNRIGVESQCFAKGDLFNNENVFVHTQIALGSYFIEDKKIEETNLVAGFLMIFKKSLWNKIKFQEGINFDIKFCEAVKASGGRIGIMKGIYVYHNYRMGKDNVKDKSHLLNKL